MASVVKPYKTQNNSKKVQVAEMFDNISAKYDFLNHLLSMGIDRSWRKKAIKILSKEIPKNILDVATGTGDFALESLSLNPTKIIGVDISKGMLEKGKEKIRKKGLEDLIELQYGDSENLPFSDHSFDAVTVGFGVRNFENLERGLTEIHRVLKKGGTSVILEFSQPKNFPIKQLYHFYFHSALPKIGNAISKDSSAYTYLPESVDAFPDGKKFLTILEKCNFRDVRQKKLSGGIASIYVSKK